MKLELATLQVGHNEVEGVVKLRALAPPGTLRARLGPGFIVQSMSPAAARTLAAWLVDGAAGKTLKVSDGVSWVEHEIPPASAEKFAADLLASADIIDKAGGGS